MNSSIQKDGHTLASTNLLKPLEELANLRDDPTDFERFCKRWPGFVYVPEDRTPNRFYTLRSRRAALRDVWRGSSLALSELLLPNGPPEEIQNSEHYVDRDESGFPAGSLWTTQVNVDWQRGQFVYEPRTDFQKALYGLFLQSSRAKICGNPNCPAPYFIAKKVIQRYCSDKCAEVFQQEWKRKWWAEHGDEWRRSRMKAKRKLRHKA